MSGERNPNLGLQVVNMGSLCFYMRAESRFFFGFVGVCTKSAPFLIITQCASTIFCSKTGQTRFLLDKRDTCWLNHNLDPLKRSYAVDVIFVR